MARSAFYEESAISTREKAERRSYLVFHIASIVMLIIAALLVLFSLTSVPSILGDEELTGVQKVVSIVVWCLPILSLVGFFFLFRYIKRKFNVSFDYTFVEDELRVTKVFNNKSRKHLHTFKADQILQIGYVDSASFERTIAGIQGKKRFPLRRTASLQRVRCLSICSTPRRLGKKYMFSNAGRSCLNILSLQREGISLYANDLS